MNAWQKLIVCGVVVVWMCLCVCRCVWDGWGGRSRGVCVWMCESGYGPLIQILLEKRGFVLTENDIRVNRGLPLIPPPV